LKPRASDSMKFREVFIMVPLCSTSYIRSTALKSKNHLCVKKKTGTVRSTRNHTKKIRRAPLRLSKN
jgi:hypothetical protein